MKYSRIWQAVLETPWAIIPSKLNAIVELLELRAAGVDTTPYQAAVAPGASLQGSVQVLPLFGVVSQRMDLMSEMSGGTSTERFAAQFQQALDDPSVGSIVLNVDSPGGSVYGVQELADIIYAARGQKPVVAVSNSLMASAAYWISSAADEIVVTPNGEVGSIGVLAAHEDVSKAADAAGVTTTLITAGQFKAEANPYEPLTSEARAAIQGRVDAYYTDFLKAVARGRGTTPKAVRDGYGQGRVVGARDAVALGLADRVDTLDATVARLAGGRRRAGARAEDDQVVIAALEEVPPGIDETVYRRAEAEVIDLAAADLDYRRRRARLHAG